MQSRIHPGDRALILLPPGRDFPPAFFGVLYAGGVAIPTYPPSGSRADRASARLRGIIPDADVALVVSSRSVRRDAHRLETLVPELRGLPWLEIDDVDRPDGWRPARCGGDTLALLQYTSGSTTTPRGVMVSHANLLHNLAHSATLAQHGHESISVSWLPVNHDMGLIDGILQPAFSGFGAYLMAPAAFLQRPSRWLQAISRYGATHSGGPNFAYDLCARRVSDSERDALDLSSWQTAFNGSEPVRRLTLEGFHRRFAPCGFRWDAFRPAYGLAESTLLVTSTGASEPPSFLDADPARPLVDCGKLDGPTAVRIVDPSTHVPVTHGVGEIWVSGKSVALGYWKRPLETRETFHASIAGIAGSYLRTGDLGCAVDGRLYVTGRLKDLLIVRGVKHHPQDLESTAEAAEILIRPGGCAVFMVDQDGEERLMLAAEIAPKRRFCQADVEAAVVQIRGAVGEAHQVSLSGIAFVRAGALPRTTSGKLQRFLCREWFVSERFEILAAWHGRGVSVGPAVYPPAEAVA